jgi:hypothetical protein
MSKWYHLQFTISASPADENGIAIAATSGYVKFESTSVAGSSAVNGISRGFYTNNTLTNGSRNGNRVTPHLSPNQDRTGVLLILNNIGNNPTVTKNNYTSISTLTPSASVSSIPGSAIDNISKDFVNATGGIDGIDAMDIGNFGIIAQGGVPLVNSSGDITYTILPTTYSTASVFTFTTVAGPGNSENDFGAAVNNCFLEGTKLYAHLHDKDVYVNIEDLRKGDLVNTYLHGKKAIKFIGKDTLFNNPDKWNGCLKKIPKSGDMIDDLYVTGAHSLLVDELSEKESDGILAIYGTADRKVDDKFMLNAWVSDKAEPVLDADFFTIYHLVLEHDDDENKKYGIWANGLLTELQCEKHFLKGTDGSLKIPPL